MTLLADLAWPAIDRIAGRSILAVPLGSTEQHGPHLPCGTDTTIAAALAEGLAAHRSDVVVTPPMPFGSSGEHADFAGTLSIGGPALELVVVELVRTADAFAGVVLVSAHGGNQRSLQAASARLHDEGRRTLVWTPSVPRGDAHAGRTETSLMLALRPSLVDVGVAAPGDVRPLQELMPTLERAGVAAVSPNGVLGDPTGAAAGEGDELLQVLIADLSASVEAWAA